MRPLSCVLAALLFTVALTSSASAAIVVEIDRAVQRMAVTVDGAPRYNWRVSTARRGYITPPGTYHPEMLARHWFSRKYYNSPMPHSIFFYGGFAIHGIASAASAWVTNGKNERKDSEAKRRQTQ